MRKPIASFFLGAIVGGVAVAALMIVSHRRAQPPSAAQQMASLSEAEIQKLESTAQRLFSKGTYPLLAAHVRSAELAMSLYDRRKDEVLVQRDCAQELAMFLRAVEAALVDTELSGIWSAIEEKQKAVEKFVAEHPELQPLIKEANQSPEPTSGLRPAAAHL